MIQMGEMTRSLEPYHLPATPIVFWVDDRKKKIYTHLGWRIGFDIQEILYLALRRAIHAHDKLVRLRLCRYSVWNVRSDR